MPFEPQTQEEIYQDLLGLIKNQSPRLTNFSERTPNYILTHDGYAGQFDDFQEGMLAVQLSGWVDYAGGPIEEEDLIDLNIDPSSIDLALLNSMMDDEDLDALGRQSSVTRDPGEEATGEVLITVPNEGGTVSSGIEFGTTPDSQGNYLSFITTDEVTAADQSTTVTAPIEAEEVGSNYNVGSGRIEYIPGSAPGVSSVTNPDSTSGGEDPEANDEYRQRIINSTSQQSGGGTKSGIRGVIMDGTDGILSGDIYLDELQPDDPNSTKSYTYVDVVVDHNQDQNSTVVDLVDQSRPIGIEHNVVYPDYVDLDIDATLISNDASSTLAEDEIVNYVSGLAIGESFYRDELIQRTMNTDEDIKHIDPLNIVIQDEPHQKVSGQSQYELNSLAVDDGIVEVTGTLASTGSSGTVPSTEYSLLYDSDDHLYGIDFSAGGNTDDPQDGTEFYITYDILRDADVKERQLFSPGAVNVTVSNP